MDDGRFPRHVVPGEEGRVEAQAGAQGQDHVGLHDQAGGHRVAARSHLPGAQRVVRRDGIAVPRRRRDGRPEGVGQGQDLVVSAAVLDPGADHDDRPLGPGQQGRGMGDRVGRTGRQGGRAGGGRIPRRLELGGAGQHVPGQVQRDGSPTGGGGHPEGTADVLGDPVGRRNGPDVLGDRTEQGVLVDLLEGVPVDVARRQCAGQGHHRREGGRGLGQAGDEVGGAGAVLPGQHHAGPARCPGEAVGHVGAGALVVDADVGDVVGVVQAVEELHGRRTDEAEDVGDPVGLQRFDRGEAAGHALRRGPGPGPASPHGGAPSGPTGRLGHQPGSLPDHAVACTRNRRIGSANRSGRSSSPRCRRPGTIATSASSTSAAMARASWTSS